MKISDLSSHDSLLILLKGKTFLLQQHPLSMFLPLLLQVYSHKFHTIRNFPKINEFSRSENNISKYSALFLSLSLSPCIVIELRSMFKETNGFEFPEMARS